MSHPYASRPVAETHVWLTPPEILAPLRPFDLDPCAAPYPRPWDTATAHYVEENDGLSLRWFGRVWLNPPYGQHTKRWLARMAEHNNGIALVFARTETEMFQKHVWPVASAVLFLAKRPHFHYADGSRAKGNSGGPMCLIAYGDDNAEVLANSGLGPVLYIDNPRYELTDLGKAYRDAMQRGAKLNGGVKAGEDKE